LPPPEIVFAALDDLDLPSRGRLTSQSVATVG
jgi:hypothetical protein